MDEMGFQEVEHTADIALRVWGQDLLELFTNAARGLAWLIGDPREIAPETGIPLELTAYDAETLLVAWLGELLYLYERDGTLFTVFELNTVTPTHLQGTVRGGPVGETHNHIKAVTFSEMAIQSTERGLETTVVFDV